jgi:hypothetical protein
VRLLILLLILLAGPALAQQPSPEPREPAAMRGVVLALQQMAVSTEQYISDVTRRLAEKDAQINELTQKCGENCKTGGK